MEEWLILIADAVREVNGEEMREIAKGRFWEVLSNGEMDVSRAEVCVIWWNTRGGRERVLSGQTAKGEKLEKEEVMMSGALPNQSKL